MHDSDNLESDSAQHTQAELDELFRQISDAAPILIWISDANKNCVWVNKPWLDFTGRTMAEETGEGWAAGIHPDDLAAFRSGNLAAFQNRRPFSTEYRLRRHDGEYRWLLDNGAPRYSPAGDFLGYIGSCVDITDRKQVESELEDARLRFESTLEAAEVGTWTWDYVNDRVVADKNLARMFSLPPDALAGTKIENFIRVIHPDDRERVVSGIQRALDAGDAFDMTYRIVQHDDRIKWIIARGRVIRDASGAAVALPGVAIDITRTVTAEEMMRQSEDRYRTLFNLIEEGFCVIEKVDGDPVDFRYIEANPQFKKQTGVANVVGHTVRELFPNEPEERFDIYDKILQTGEPQRFQRQLRAQNKTLELYAFRVNDQPKHRVAVFFSDVTERKRAEAELMELNRQIAQQSVIYNTTLSTITDYVYRLDSKGRFIYANQALLDLWGLKEMPAGGVTMPELDYDKGVEQQVLRGVRTVFAERRMIKDQTSYTSPTGATEYHEFIFNPVFKADGSVDFIIGSSRDIAEHKKLEDALKEADRRKDEFLATLAHELRNPLAPIRSGLEIIGQQGDMSPVVDRTFGIIRRQTDQIMRLVEDLIEISRITLGKVKLKIEHMPLSLAIDMAVETSLDTINANKHTLALDTPHEPLYIDADCTRISQIVLNILNNAAKYTPSGGHISLSVKKEGGWAVITVADDGIGIPPESMVKVFRLFGQLQTPSDQARSGLGIGLSVAKELTEMHGGTISAASEGEGKGSRFTVKLPLSARQQPEEKAGSGQETDDAAPEIAGRKRRGILVVDDNADAAEMLQLLLEMEGYEVKTAFDAESALEMVGMGETAAVFTPAVFLCDIGLPRMSGYELAARLREIMPGVLLVSISGWGQEEDKRRSKEAGFDHHLVKPVAIDNLMSVLKSFKHED